MQSARERWEVLFKATQCQVSHWPGPLRKPERSQSLVTKRDQYREETWKLSEVVQKEVKRLTHVLKSLPKVCGLRVCASARTVSQFGRPWL